MNAGITDALRFKDKCHCINHIMLIICISGICCGGQQTADFRGAASRYTANHWQRSLLALTERGTTQTLSHNDSLLLFSSFHVGALQTCINAESFYKEYRDTSFSVRDHCIFSMRLSKCILKQIIFCVWMFWSVSSW